MRRVSAMRFCIWLQEENEPPFSAGRLYPAGRQLKLPCIRDQSRRGGMEQPARSAGGLEPRKDCEPGIGDRKEYVRWALLR